MENEIKIEEVKEKKKGKGSLVTIVVLILVILGLCGYIAYDKGWVFSSKTDNGTKESGTTSKESDDKTSTTADEKKSLEGQFYLLEGFNNNRRYFLAYDNADKLGEDNTFIDGRKRNVYLVDMNISKDNEFIKKIDLASLIKDVYNEKINSIPDVIAQGTVNETKKSDCKEYKIQYTTASDNAMFNGAKEVPFGIYYACIKDGKGELSLGTEYYKLDVSSMKVTK